MNELLNVVANIMLILASCLVMAFILVFVVQMAKIKAVWTRLTTHKKDEPSEFGLIIDSISGSAGRAMAMEIKTTLMGVSSGITRGEKAIELAIAKDSNPGIFALLEAIPSLKKIVNRNPALLGLVGNVLNKSGPGNGGAPNSQVKFKL